MILFFIGIIEMLIVTTWTKLVMRARIIASGAVTMVNVLIWYYVLQSIVNNINNWTLVVLYAAGCAIGTVAGTYFFSSKEEKERQKRFSASDVIKDAVAYE